MVKLQKRRTHLLVLTVMILSLSTGTVQANEYHIKPMKQKLNKQVKYRPKNIFQQLAMPLKYMKEQEDEKFKAFHEQESIKYWQWRNEQIKQEQLKMQQEKEEQNQWVTVRLSYYTNDYKSCQSTLGITASGKKAQNGMIAAPSIFSFGTVFELEDGEKLVCEDRGNAIQIKDNIIWLDVFIPNASEEYLDKLGVKYMKARIVK